MRQKIVYFNLICQNNLYHLLHKYDSIIVLIIVSEFSCLLTLKLVRIFE